MSLVSLPKTLTAKTEAKAADVMADFNALLNAINGNLDGENLAESIGAAILKPGMIVMTGASTADVGFLLCQGQAVSRTTYAALFARIGTTFGAGDGVTTFNLPDLRARTAIGPDGGTNRLTISANGLGGAGGDQHLQGHTHDQGNLETDVATAAHHHHLDVTAGNRHEGTGFEYVGTNWSPGFHTNTSEDFALHSHTIHGRTGLTGSGGSENMPPYAVLNYQIKF
jgi:microcystin-dependent protein